MLTSDEMEEMAPEEVLEAMRREVVAYVAEHYEPVLKDEDVADVNYTGTNRDPEHVWNEALRHALGPDDWWERYATDPGAAKTWTEEGADRMAKVMMAFVAVARVGMDAAHDLQHQDRLFGPAAEMPDAYTPAWTVLIASGFDDKTPEHRIDLIVGNYLVNVRDGLMDATGSFYDLEEDE